MTATCSKCGGSGWVGYVCSTCTGTGRTRVGELRETQALLRPLFATPKECRAPVPGIPEFRPSPIVLPVVPVVVQETREEKPCQAPMKAGHPPIILPSKRPFCVFGANGESATFVEPFLGDVSIYALIDPRDSTVRYIGKTTSPEDRLFEHQQDLEGKTRKSRWIVELKALELSPTMEILTRVARFGWEDAEKRWIAFYANRGALLNVEIGGKGYLHAYLESRIRSART